MPQPNRPLPGDLRAALAPLAVCGMVEWTEDGQGVLVHTARRVGPAGDDLDATLAATTTEAPEAWTTAAPDVVPCPLLHLHGALGLDLNTEFLAQVTRRLARGGTLTLWIDAPPGSPEVVGALARLRDCGEFNLRQARALDGGCWIVAQRTRARLRVALFPDAPGACLQIRTLGPLEALEARGQVELCLLPRDATEPQLAREDLLLLQRFGGLPAVRLLLMARRLGVPTALELDDDFFNLPWFNPAAESYGRFEARILLQALLRGVDTVVTSTPYLQRQMQAHQGDVRTLHNLVDTTLFQRRDPAADAAGITTFGYIGTRTHEEDFRPLLAPLRELLETMPDRVRAVFIGHVPEELRRLPGVRYLGWFATYQNAAAALSRSGANVALAPLMDLEFNRSKSAMKYLEYGAAGIPGIFSAVDAYRPFIRHGENGLLVEQHRASAWGEALRYVVDHPERRRQMADAAHRDVVEHHSIERRAGAFLDLYRGIVDDANRRRPRDATVEAGPATPAGRPVLTAIVLLHEPIGTSLPALASFVRDLPNETQWIAVADDADMAELLDLSTSVEVVRPRSSQSVGHAVGRALALARAERVLVLDSTVSPRGDLAPALIRAAERFQVAAIGPRTLLPSSPQSAHALVGQRLGLGADVAEALSDAAHEAPVCEVRTLTPECVLLDRALTLDAGGIEDDGLLWEDALTDLCQRLRARGHRVAVANAVHVEPMPQRLPALPLDWRQRSRERLASRLPAGERCIVAGDDPVRWIGSEATQLDLWIWSRPESPYLTECLERIGRWTDVPCRVHVLHRPDDPAAARSAAEHGAVSRTLPEATGPWDVITRQPGSTHAAFLHDGVMVTPRWLNEMLGLLHGSNAALVGPFSNDGSPEQRFLVDRGLILRELDELIAERLSPRSDRERTAEAVAGFCVLADLRKPPPAGAGDATPPALWARASPERRVAVATRAYVHVLSHPEDAAELGFGPWPGGPLDREPPGVAELIRLGDRLQDTREFVARMRPLLDGLRDNPVNGRLLAGMGLLYLGRGDLQQAMSVLERARRLDPFSPDVRAALRHARETLDRGPVPA